MSIERRNITLPDTLRTFARNSDMYKLTESLFITTDNIIFTEDEFEDIDFWYSELGINIFPLHGINEFASKDIDSQFVTSRQDFDYKINNGKYIHEFKYDWSLDYHKLINEISGSTVKVIYRSGNVLRAKNVSGDVTGFSISKFELEKLLFSNGDSIGNSKLMLEWLDSDELNVYGYDVEVNWNPQKLNRLVLNINLTFAEDTITMYVRYLGQEITGIQASDITITDDINGNIEFGVFVPGSGVYQLSSFSKVITTACMNIQSTLYIGAKRFTFTVVVAITNNFIYENGDNKIYENGDNRILEN